VNKVISYHQIFRVHHVNVIVCTNLKNTKAKWLLLCVYRTNWKCRKYLGSIRFVYRRTMLYCLSLRYPRNQKYLPVGCCLINSRTVSNV